MKQFAYIIKSHNELPYLRLMLWSLKYNNPGMWEAANIYVFANNCNDGTKQWCDKNGVWCKEVNLPGLYSIWNHAMEITYEPYVIFSASDFVLAPGFWNKITTNAEIFKEYYYHFTGTCLDNGMSYGHEDEPARRWYKRDCGDNWQDFDYEKFIEYIKEFEHDDGVRKEVTQYCPFLTTREHFNLLGGFNLAQGDYPSDVDETFVRVGREKGRQPCIVPGACFYHFGKKSILRRDTIEYDWKDIENI